jgi:hypothetical protein
VVVYRDAGRHQLVAQNRISFWLLLFNVYIVVTLFTVTLVYHLCVNMLCVFACTSLGDNLLSESILVVEPV